MAFFIVIAAVLVAAMLPMLIWVGMTTRKGIEETRTNIQESSSTVQKEIAAQSGNVQNLVSSQEKLIERIQHLEAIVTSEAWDTLAKENQDRIKEKLLEIDDESITDEKRAANMARTIERE